MSNIFLSYAREDATAVDQIEGALRYAGHDVWVDRTALQGGDIWQEAIAAAIGDCDVFVIVLTPASIAARMVLKEISLADEREKPIIPVLLQEVQLPSAVALPLSGVQRIDCTTNFSRGIAALVDALTRRRASSPSGATPLRARNGFILDNGLTLPRRTQSPTDDDVNAAVEQLAIGLSEFVVLLRSGGDHADYLQASAYLPYGSGRSSAVECRLWLNEESYEHFHLFDFQGNEYYEDISAIKQVMLHWLHFGRLPSGIKVRNVTGEFRDDQKKPPGPA